MTIEEMKQRKLALGYSNEERRAELIDGVFYDIASPSSNHQIIIGELYLQLKLCERAHKGACRVLLPPLDVQLDQDRYTMLKPDLPVVCDAEKIRKRLVFGAPDLAIEILSPSSHSRDLVPVSISEGECVIDFEEISSMLV